MQRLISHAAFFCVLCGTVELPAAEVTKPNVLLIMTDDQGYGDLSIHGHPFLRTPHIDRLAREGVQFERFFVNSFCAPTRAALLTGRYPLRCGVWGVTHNTEAMRPDEVTLAEVLRDAGYHTGCCGKWHNGEQFPFTPPGQGFAEFFGFHNGHINNYFDVPLLRGATFEPTKGYITDVLTDEAMRFIERQRRGPFLCYVAYNAPHSPFQVPDADYERFRAKGLDESVSAYFGMCENIDDNVGRLLDTLERLQLAENTIVVFLTDNGGTAGAPIFNAGMRGGKTSVHEGGCRVPLFVRWPARLREPRVVKPICAHIDMLPTLLDLCGVPLPDGVRLDGVSLRPLLEGRGQDWPDRTLFTHNPISDTNRYPGAVRTQQYRLVREIRGRQGGSNARPADDSARAWQLYDMRADPSEQHDLAAAKPDIVSQLSRRYQDWFDDVSRDGLRRFPIPLGYDEENSVRIYAPQAFFNGQLRFYSGPGFAHDWLTNWVDASARIWFELDVVRAGIYEVELGYACPSADAGSKIRLSAAAGSLEATVPAAAAEFIPLPHRDGGKARYFNRNWGTLRAGTLSLQTGPATLAIEVISKPGASVMDFKHVVLKRLERP